MRNNFKNKYSIEKKKFWNNEEFENSNREVHVILKDYEFANDICQKINKSVFYEDIKISCSIETKKFFKVKTYELLKMKTLLDQLKENNLDQFSSKYLKNVNVDSSENETISEIQTENTFIKKKKIEKSRLIKMEKVLKNMNDISYTDHSKFLIDEINNEMFNESSTTMNETQNDLTNMSHLTFGKEKPELSYISNTSLNNNYKLK